MDEKRISWGAARKNANLTQEQAAHSLGISTQTLSSYESYKTYPEAPMVMDMCHLYNRGPELIFLTKPAN